MSAPYRGGCRPRMAGCTSACGHRRVVEEYRLARWAQLLRAEAAGAGLPDSPEWRAFFRGRDAPTWDVSEDPLTFRAWLRGLAAAQGLELGEWAA